jgi:Icc-related predicted phosphoesterase
MRKDILQRVRAWVERFSPDCLVIAGDIASASQASETLAELRRYVPSKPIAVCLGNHDFWLHDDARNECRGLSAVIDRYWIPAAEASGIHLLDRANFRLGALTIVGGYGHYDLGFALPGLSYGGVAVTMDDYLRGYLSSDSPLRWRDFQLMPGALNLQKIAFEEVQGVTARIREAGDSPSILVLHTPPFEELLGVPARTPEGLGPYAFFRAYLGNRSMGEALRTFKLLAVICGHTHRASGPLRMHETIGINVGSDYGHPRAVLYASETRAVERIPDL